MKFIISIAILLILAITSLVIYFIDKKQRSTFLNKFIVKMRIQDLDIDHSSPVSAKQKIIIDAPIDIVWNKVTNIRKWQTWQTNISKVNINSTPLKSIPFTWKSNGIPFKSIVHTNKFHTSFGWIGTTFGGQAIHNWLFISNKTKTIVIVEESLQGLLTSILPTYLQKKLNEEINSNLGELKKACELQNISK